jgi:hypothetical protein
MSFAELRQTVLQAHTLSLDYFGEQVEIDAQDGSEGLVTATVKIEHEEWRPARRTGADDQRQGTFDERERIRVTVSRDPTFEGAYQSRPLPACRLYRAAAIDADRRPFTYRGEVAYEGAQHAVYLFERPRRAAQGKGA